MMPYFPRTYPDELLYSVLARYHRHMCCESPKRTLEELFGGRELRVAANAPGHLRALAANLPAERGLTAERLATEFTLYPYYIAFEPPRVRAAVLVELIDSPAEGIHLNLGTVPGGVAPPDRLRYCPGCLKAMEERYGELYWRRAHQLPGVLVCPEHGIPLTASSATGWLGHRCEYRACALDACTADGPDPPWAKDEHCMELLRRIAVRSAALLDAVNRAGFPGGSIS
jgi:hypothetical protein